MERILIFEDGIIQGDIVREIKSIFPETIDSFRQRKSYDEYYYVETNVNVDINKINELNTLHYSVEITKSEIKIDC